MYLAISPEEGKLKKPDKKGKKRVEELLGIPYDTLQQRARNTVYLWLEQLFNEKAGALHHYYRADTRSMARIDQGNFLMAFNYLTMYDRYGDQLMLEKATSCFKWAYNNTTETHPMFTWQGGVSDGFNPDEIKIKDTGDAFLTCLALFRRTNKDEYLFYAKQFHNFIKQSHKAGFKSIYNKVTHQWSDTGFSWRAFGYPIIAYLEYYHLTGEKKYLTEAISWGEHALSLQADNGAFYLIDGQFWNSDLTANELRSLIYLYEITGEEVYLNSAIRYADWLLKRQSEDGTWPIGIDRDGEVCAPNIGPGDIPHIGISLACLHQNTREERYLDSAVATLKYSIKMQAIEEGRYPFYLDDPKVKWGFWSWEPLYDYSLSGDQSVHHIRGMLIIGDYLANL